MPKPKSLSFTEKAKLVKAINQHELEKILVIEQVDNLAAQTELLRAQADYNTALAESVRATTSRENKQYS